MRDISAETFDLIVIGAGINGAGIARDAAMRGLKVILLDKGDIGGGTSSWSTRLIHGGLRYLEHGEFGLVRESLREREVLFCIAPHLVKPLPMMIPLYGDALRGRWIIRVGMIAYDVLSLDKSLPHHRILSPAEALQKAPGLNVEELLGAALYYDAQVEFAERLVVENALSARNHSATIKTYARVDEFMVEKDRVIGVGITDLATNESHSIRGRVSINAAGPWVDQVAGRSDPVEVTRLIGGTKGSHIVVGHFPGAPETALYVEAKTDRRPFFIIPWNGNFLIGTTDRRYEGDLDAVEIDDDEIEYLLSETNRVIPEAKLKRDSILFAYSGIRPLPFATNDREAGITRRHFIHDHAPRLRNFFSIVGGKLTTYRNLSEQAVDLIFKTLKLNVSTCTTNEVPLPGAVSSDFDAFGKQFARDNGLSVKTNDHLLRVYGTRAAEVLQVADKDPELLKTLDSETGAIGAEVIFAFQHELAQTLADCLLRRTMVGLNSSAGVGADERAAQIGQQHLGWSERRMRSEIAAYRGRQAITKI